MKNLLKLGKTLSKVEQKQIFGGTNRLTKCHSDGGDFGDPVDCSNSGGTGGGADEGTCQTDADCSNMAIWANNGNSDCSEGDLSCGHWSSTGQGTCTQVSAGGLKMCII